MEAIKPTWQNVADLLPEEGYRVMLTNSKFPSGYPCFAVLRIHKGQQYWRLMPERLNASFEHYDLWAYTGQPVHRFDPLFAQPKGPRKQKSETRTS